MWSWSAGPTKGGDTIAWLGLERVSAVGAREHGVGLGSWVAMECWTHRRWGQVMVVGPQRSAWA